METNQKMITEKIASIITDKINVSMKKEGLELVKMNIGMQIILLNLSKLILVYLSAMLCGVTVETTIMLAVFAAIRRNSFGIHSQNNIICTLETVVVFTGAPIILRQINVNEITILLLFITISALLYRYSPADTENHPLLGQANRDKLKRKTLLTWFVIMVFALLIQNKEYVILIVAAACLQTVTILPATYKIFRRSVRNYEKYE